MMRILLLLCLAAVAVADESDPQWRSPAPENLVYLDLPGGTVVIELAPRFAPRAVAQLKRLAGEGFYDGLSFYRVIDGFVAQGGDPEDERTSDGGKAALPPEFEISLDPEHFVLAQAPDLFAQETGFVDGFPAGRDPASGQTWLTHCPGTVAMARDNAPDSATTELYIVIGQAPRYLDRNMSVIGRVIDGMAAVQTIARGPADANGMIDDAAQRTKIERMRVAADVPSAERPAVQVMDTTSQAFAEMVEDRRNRTHEFFAHRPPRVIDVCQVPIPTRAAP